MTKTNVTSWVLTGLTAAFLLLASALPKLIGHPAVAETMGWCC